MFFYIKWFSTNANPLVLCFAWLLFGFESLWLASTNRYQGNCIECHNRNTCASCLAIEKMGWSANRWYLTSRSFLNTDLYDTANHFFCRSKYLITAENGLTKTVWRTRTRTLVRRQCGCTLCVLSHLLKSLNVASNNVQFYVVTFNLSLEPVLDILEF